MTLGAIKITRFSLLFLSFWLLNRRPTIGIRCKGGVPDIWLLLSLFIKPPSANTSPSATLAVVLITRISLSPKDWLVAFAAVSPLVNFSIKSSILRLIIPNSLICGIMVTLSSALICVNPCVLSPVPPVIV